MKVKFREEALSELFYTGSTSDRKYRNICRNKKLLTGYVNAVRAMMGMDNVEGLKRLSFLHYERLKYQRDEPRSSVRIANGYIERLIFTETDDGIEIELIEIDSTHYGNR